MDNQQPIPPMPRPNFESMKDKALTSYLTKNAVYVQNGDLKATRADLLATAASVADRKARDFVLARAKAQVINDAVDAASAALQLFPRGPLGLTPDDVKSTPEWRAAYHQYNHVSQISRKFNGPYFKRFADELRHERQIRLARKLVPFQA